MENINLQAPAFPPQVAQDHLGRIIAPIPGMTKLEYFSLQLLPTFLEIGKKTDLVGVNGKNVTAYVAAIQSAKLLLEELDKEQKKESQPADIINLND